MLYSAFATDAAYGTPLSLLGAGLMTLGLFVKAKVEERFLRAELGRETYDAYAKRVPMLLPFVHWSS